MSDITVGQLPTKTNLLDADMVVIDDGAQSYKMYWAQLKNLLRTEGLVPTGAVMQFPIDAVTGYLLCNGQAVSRTQYSALFSVIGTRFGEGDGTSTFNLPDYRGCFLRGLGGDSAANMYTKQAMGAPNITGTFSAVRCAGNEGPAATGAFTKKSNWDAHCGGGSSDDWGGNYEFDASRSNSAYGAAEEIRPVNFAINFFIKY